MNDDFRDRAKRMACWLWFQSLTVEITVIAGSWAMFRHTPLSILLIVIAGFPAVFFSIFLAFDAYLFGLIARHADELDGCRNVDRFLADAGLKPHPESTRGLDLRIAGTRRLIYAQLVFAALFATGFLWWVGS